MINEKFANAIQYGDIDTVKEMLDNSELVNIDVNEDDHTYIYIALMTNRFDILDVLISHGGDLHGDEEFGLYLAVINSRYDMVEYILNSIDKVSVEAWSQIANSATTLGDEHMREIIFDWARNNVDKIDTHTKPNIINLLFNRKRNGNFVND